ncbi:hypothetical protein [Pseudonocardia kunmingensis]|uniref:Major facilitator superfamily (MFS) profile domain-containing protein n=1 Tax=Pseudonocardia kunmingensis TaxID=630975 RepID=A0A543CXE0_9PSEU|nr:hypothetical protein [Pseudonocardia kunmingensis]TQM01777.1 hypothetical protein FB558_8292 [Pseudonocardia kunmingensis]
MANGAMSTMTLGSIVFLFARAFGVGTTLVAVMGGLGPFVTGVISDVTGSSRIPIYLWPGCWCCR